jgi:hypothetical protein
MGYVEYGTTILATWFSLIVAKFNSYTCLQKKFSVYLNRFVGVCLQSFEKMQKLRNFFAKKQYGFQKNEEFYTDFESAGKV